MNKNPHSFSFDVNNETAFKSVLYDLYRNQSYQQCIKLISLYYKTHGICDDVKTIEVLSKMAFFSFEGSEVILLKQLERLKNYDTEFNLLFQKLNDAYKKNHHQIAKKTLLKLLNVFGTQIATVYFNYAEQKALERDISSAFKYYKLAAVMTEIKPTYINHLSFELNTTACLHCIDKDVNDTIPINNENKKLTNAQCLSSLDILYGLQQYYLKKTNTKQFYQYAVQFIRYVQPKLGIIFEKFAQMISINQPVYAKKLFLIALLHKPSVNNFIITTCHIRKIRYYTDALRCAKKALELYPENTFLKVEQAITQKYVIDFQGNHYLKSLFKELLHKNDASTVPISPLMIEITSDDPDINFKLAKRYAKNLTKNLPNLSSPFTFENYKSRQKIKIAYMSTGFGNHPTGRMIYKMFQYHDLNQFDVTCYAICKADNSRYAKAIKDHCCSFIEVDQLSSIQLAKKIHQDKIDILIDLDGYMENTQLNTLSYKPAPIQISYLGYPGTTGTNFIDYIIADEIIIPATQQQYYSETVCYLPNCYQVYSFEPKIEKKNLSKANYGLPEDKFIFAILSMPHKIDEDAVNAWVNILSAVDNAVLCWLIPDGDNEVIKQNIYHHFLKHNIEQNRLIFIEHIDKDKHLERIQCFDLVLDTFICNLHSSASDILSQHVPIITKCGRHFSSRVCASLLHYIGLEHLVTETIDQYINMAVKLAKEPAFLASYQDILKNNFHKTLGNTALTVKNLESLYKTLST